ncbi:MAG TPA: hypothetical protein ENJ77_01475, partial [Candidatus Moranbacteria bacterium]|nr:hypothetical protein [Candidatus Moranbacteria bacterium]
MGLLKKLVKKTPWKWDDRLYDRSAQATRKYFAPAPKVRPRDFVRELPGATKKVFRGIYTGTAGRDAARAAEKLPFFKPTAGKVRIRDVVRELPSGIHETLKGIPQWGTRAAISVYETPKTLRTGRATGKWYETPFGRLNSFQSEAQNRLRRGESAASAIGQGVLDVAFGFGNLSGAAKPLLSAAKRAPIKEARNLASDLTRPVFKVVRREKSLQNSPLSRFGVKTPQSLKNAYRRKNEAKSPLFSLRVQTKPFRSQFMRLINRPGLTVKNISTSNPLDAKGRLKRGVMRAYDTELGHFLAGIKQAENTRKRLRAQRSALVEKIKTEPVGGKRQKYFIDKYKLDEAIAAQNDVIDRHYRDAHRRAQELGIVPSGNHNTQAINRHKAKARKTALGKLAKMPRGAAGIKQPATVKNKVLPEVSMKKGYRNAYKVYSGDKSQAKVAQLLPEVAKKTSLPQDIVVKQAFFEKMARKHPEIDRRRLFDFVKTLHIPDNIQQLSSAERLNFFRKLENSVKTNIVGTVKNSPLDNAVTTSFLTKSK